MAAYNLNSGFLHDKPAANNLRKTNNKLGHPHHHASASTATSKIRYLPLIYDHQKPWWDQILDPGSEFANKWNHIFLVACLAALFLDPFYFFLPHIGGPVCMQSDVGLGVLVTVFRCVVDLFSFLHMSMKFRTAYVAPSSRVFGRGELVTDPKMITMRYLKSDFWIDLAATLPLPQIVIWFISPTVKSHTAAHANHTISLIIIVQYIPRLFVIFPLNRRIIKTTGVVAKTAWAGAAYNLLLYLLASHVLGASWYLMSIERQYSCWRQECRREMNLTHSPSCTPLFLDCKSLQDRGRQYWLKATRVLIECDVRYSGNFEFGMFSDAFTEDVASSNFIEKYFYCLWWGLKNLSSYGQNLKTSTYVGETLFSSIICLAGLFLFSLLIGNVQNYLQSSTARLEEWRVKRRDTEEWMRHRQLPPDLQNRIRRFVQYKWIATRGVDEEEILQALPLDLRCQIQRHLCLALVRRVPFFSQMDDQLLDAICERLVSSLSTKDTYLVREGDPVIEMLFIIRGELESSTTDGGRTGFFNSITLKPGDFCGEELLTWALMPSSTLNLPSSTRTVKSLTEVEAFALRAEDLKFVANQFKRLHSKKLQHAFRYYSHQWRTWGACFIQAAWRRHTRKKLAEELLKQESLYYLELPEGVTDPGAEDYDYDHEVSGAAGNSMVDSTGQHLSATFLASKFAANTRRGLAQKVKAATTGLEMPKKLFKPNEPDFSADS
ncbi:cyclic nucleotide-gated ion channel 18-like [Diospyros lotus]|uniref:cyclic nucleotide-gated ion channel 18-like n=1 Tax=Diospyros lotus TaxID=55363 RepID=UPI0022534598|nr:cyclic nucleotide-gated ion channel 18-like [Diospyros lotus]XP_052183327.1 cyclic nucleotide-gated ion channel 18-like [Diospyros lotus]XP_052183328.1 cyclic nucleotide-gated ion channel 18-like [Diospyros lotus]